MRLSDEVVDGGDKEEVGCPMWKTLSGLVIGLILTAPACVCASAVLDVNSDLPASVTLDGRPVGYVPLRVAQVPGGDHRLLIRALDGRGAREFVLRVPYGASVSRTIEARFEEPPPPPAPTVVVVEPRPVIVGTIYPAPIIVGRGRHHRRHRW